MIQGRARSIAFRTLSVALSVLGALLVLETALRLLPVRESLEVQPVSSAQPCLHFKPNREVLYSTPWNFEVANRVRVNNYGFVNNQDYDHHSTTPLLAVIGDSYVEALIVPYEDTLHGRLATFLGNRSRVYSFGSSGSALSQYLAYAQYAKDTFRPHAMLIVVVGNDFDESLLE